MTLKSPALQPFQLVVEFGTRRGIAVRRVEPAEAHRRGLVGADQRLDVARLIVVLIAGKALRHIIDGELRETRDAVIGLLSVHGDIVAAILEFERRELFIDAFDLLQNGGVGLRAIEPVEHARQAHGDRIDVEGGDFHWCGRPRANRE
jgi:hypothetical protein